MIRFPQQHIADSVAERILKFEQAQRASSVEAQGMRIDAALAQPVGDVAPTEGLEESIVFNAVGV